MHKRILCHNNVSVFIPNRYRHASDVMRLPCVIIEKGSGKQPTYKLLTEYGILSKRYTASDLIPLPSDIKSSNPYTKIRDCNTLSLGVEEFKLHDLQDVIKHLQRNVKIKNPPLFLMR